MDRHLAFASGFRRCVAAASCVAALSPLASADFITWISTGSHAWHDPANWMTGTGENVVPTDADIAWIPDTGTSAIVAQDAECAQLLIGDGAQLIVSGGLFECGGSATIDGSLLWTGGDLAIGGTLVVRDGGSVELEASPDQAGFGDVSIAAGGAMTVSDGVMLSMFGSLFILGTLELGDDVWFLQFNGDWVNAGSFSAGAGSHVTIAGPHVITGPSTSQFANLASNGASPITIESPIVVTEELSSGVDGTILLDDVAFVGTLQVSDGSTIEVNDVLTVGERVHLSGDATLDAHASLVVLGEVENLGGNFNTGTFTHTVGGDWASSWDGALTTGTGLIAFDGDGTFETGDNSVPAVRCTAGARTCTGGVEIVGNLTIDPGATFDVGGQLVAVRGTSLDARGSLLVGAGGTLQLSSVTSAIVRGASALLQVVGDTVHPASVMPFSSSGWGLTVTAQATLAARHFVFGGMGAAGVRVTVSASIAAVPDDLRRGRFERPYPADGAVLLDFARPPGSPHAMRWVDFADPDGTAALHDVHNVRTLAGAPNSFVNAAGNLAGASFEDDAGALVNWISDPTSVEDFQLRPDASAATISWFSTAESADLVEYVVERASVAPPGAYAVVATAVPVGANVSYTLEDATLAAGVTYGYRLSARFVDGTLELLGEGEVTPWSPLTPANVLAVAPGGPYTSIQSAIDAASAPNAIVAVGTGTYPAFTVDASVPSGLHILADGPVIIDTSSQPVLITDLPADSSVELSGLSIGQPLSAWEGVVIDGCEGVVVLDDLVVHGGAGKAGVRLDDSVRTAVHDSDVDGTPGLLLQHGSVASMGRGSLDVLELLDTSFLRTCQLVPGSSTVASTATLTSYAGVMPDVAAPAFVPLHEPFDISLQATPGQQLHLLTSTVLAWVDAPAKPKFQMPGLVPAPPFSLLLTLGPMPAGGTMLFTTSLPPNAELLGVPLVLQLVTRDSGTGIFRFGTTTTIVGMP